MARKSEIEIISILHISDFKIYKIHRSGINSCDGPFVVIIKYNPCGEV